MKMLITDHRRASHVAARTSLVFRTFSPRVSKKQSHRLRSAHDFIHVPHQKFYAEFKGWSVYHVKKMLLRFMVKQAAEPLKPVLSKSAATRSRAGMTLSIDNSVMDRFGKLLRCTWNWYSGRYHKVIRGQDLLGIVLTINHIAFPL